MKISRLHHSGGRPVCIRNSIVDGDLITTLIFDEKDDIEFHANAKPNEVKRLSNDILDFVGSHTFERAKFDALSSPEKASLLEEVARKGYELFDALIADEDKDVFISLLREEAKRDGAVSVRSTAVRIPWEFVYIEPVEGPINPLRFLGQIYLLPRIAPPRSPSGGDGSYFRRGGASPNLARDGNLDVGVVYDDWKDGKSQRHISSAWFSGQPDISIRALPQLSAAVPRRKQMFDLLRAFLFLPVDTFLFSCGLCRFPRPSHSIDIRICDRFESRFNDTASLKLRGHDHLLVFLDVDYAAYNAVSRAASLAERMHHNGAAVVVAPIGKVDPALSEQLSDRFFRHLLDGEDIGPSLLRARRYVLQQKSNPTALLWTAFGDVWTKASGQGVSA
ncbi:hypothetical protein XH84_31385 [Bradyrhizobium nanningense]|uniref:hypothetical protein n=1 Tax=Bradyrhizobium nanningense TaxID=1325118 RepID=UPI001008AEF8|nr:hypothetical protein [Bradyrhizobium nanningense]RXH25499.1 hypothetical protein XH84_31385 [Bradyrhizobium nanningense]